MVVVHVCVAAWVVRSLNTLRHATEPTSRGKKGLNIVYKHEHPPCSRITANATCRVSNIYWCHLKVYLQVTNVIWCGRSAYLLIVRPFL